MTNLPLDPDILAPWLMDEATRCLVADLANRYRLGLPAVAELDHARPLTPEHLMNEDLDLGAFEHPAVLAVMAVADPVMACAVAAAARILPRLDDGSDGARLASAIAATAVCDRVREAAAMVVAHGFDADALAALRWLARRSIDGDRRATRQALLAYIDRLAEGHQDSTTLVDDLLEFDRRLSLSPAVFRQLVLTLVEGRRIPLAARIEVIRELHRLPRSLRLEIVTRVSLLPPADQGGRAVKTMLEQVLGHLGRLMAEAPTRRRNGGYGNAAASGPTAVTPWHPDALARA